MVGFSYSPKTIIYFSSKSASFQFNSTDLNVTMSMGCNMRMELGSSLSQRFLFFCISQVLSSMGLMEMYTKKNLAVTFNFLGDMDEKHYL